MSLVLIADDDEGVRTFLAEALELDDHDVTQVADGRAAIDALRTQRFDVVVTDLQMPRADGMEVVRVARTEQPDVEVIVLTAHGAVATAVEAMKLGVLDYLEKPIDGPRTLRELVRRATARRAEITAHPEDAPATAGGAPRLTWGAPSMEPVVTAIGRVARSAATVLLLGESGTGKEVAARAIHAMSPRAGAPFVAINCAILSESLLESELFGHEKGAFTGAHALRRGRIELASGGTFFLDEIAELRPPLQAKLLRVIEERAFERVGSSHTQTADVRFIAATHRDLRAMTRDGSFREDLWHRLSVFPIRLPPLRERPEDIGPLATALLASLAAEAKRSAPRLDPAARRRLETAAWPGNVRELRNVLERALILGDGEVVREEDLAFEGVAGGLATEGGAATSDARTLEEIERATIERTLAEVGGNRRAAAARLGIGLRTLYEKLKRYGAR